MTVERKRIGWGFGLMWVFLSAVGWFMGFLGGFLASFAPIELIGQTPLGVGLASCVNAIVLGAVVGIFQWVILRERVPGAGRWVWASIAGLAVAGGVGGAVVVAGANPDIGMGSLAAVVGWTLVVALGGAVTGMLQRPVLRGQVSRAGWWMLASTVGWGLGMAVTEALREVRVQAFSPGGFFGSLAAGGVAFGAVTGGALVWLLRQPVAPEREAAEEQ